MMLVSSTVYCQAIAACSLFLQLFLIACIRALSSFYNLYTDFCNLDMR